MPKFKSQQGHPTLALVLFGDGFALSKPLPSEQDANDWIDVKIHQYGTAIVASDIVPNDILIG